jgi:hypothetical protein
MLIGRTRALAAAAALAVMAAALADVYSFLFDQLRMTLP